MSLTHSYRNLNQSASHYICCAVQDMWVLWWQHTKKWEHPNLNFYGFKSSSGVTASPCNLNHVPYPVWGLTVSFCCLGWRPKCFPALLGPESGIFWSDGLRGSHWWIRPVRRINTCTHIPVTFVSDGYFSALFLLPFCSWRYIANAGDARAVLGVQEEDGSFSVHTLSNDHSAQNDEEVARIRGEHPPSERKTVIRQVLLSLICSVRLLQHLLKPLSVVFSIRTGCLASSCRSVHLGMWSSSGVLNCRSACWSLDLISSMKTSTLSLSLQTTTHHHTWPLSLRSRTTNYGHRIASWWEKRHNILKSFCVC